MRIAPSDMAEDLVISRRKSPMRISCFMEEAEIDGFDVTNRKCYFAEKIKCFFNALR
jgi:hypothetical protein